MTINRRTVLAGAASGLAAGLSKQIAFAAGSYDPGASDKEIRIGQFGPLSGPVSSFGVLANAMAAYFRMLNDQGGINGRKIAFINYDDAYSPAKSVEAARRLVESDEVLFIAGAMGTPGNIAVQKYMNARKVPQLFLAAAASKLSDFVNNPWTMVGGTTYEIEGSVIGRYIASNFPAAKIAMLYQNDDAGRATLTGLKSGLAGKTSQIASELSYAVGDPTVDSQIVQMKLSGADVVNLITIPKMASQALQKMAALNWKPQVFLGSGNSSTRATLKPAGFENAQGVLALVTRQDPGNPLWAGQKEMQDYMAFLDRYVPNADRADDLYAIGYTIAATTSHVVRSCGDDLSRANILRQATNLLSFAAPLLVPGITMTTTPTDYVPIKKFQLMRFKGVAYEKVGDLLSAS
ncbi:ABC transporter substrate-binding protein [Bradyrhizobium sp. KBS0727]|uniref:ABC transporter substrate-binding protein n=1 Tax=unclassified Bradyrhizobium TaxID=2631580 RepID=UPI00110F1791|nr:MULTISPECIES: ABC transporter substrate-binding protein [unclassified Bradyrhizobium]QDW40632.1 ABC transporter substrate-binding protein [Bradyrhizobium sp. KBS0725]QDW47237.1 ABC transporter substrate-binding protein [Bradyrhizobium sp. KBS0727]